MACGAVVGILLLLVQAEHGRSWATAAQSSQNADQHVGFQQQPDGRLGRLGGPSQKQLRRVFSPRSAWRSSFSARTAADGGFGPGAPAGPNAESASQTDPTPVQSSWLLKANQNGKVQAHRSGSSAADHRGTSLTLDRQNWKDRTGLLESSQHLGKPPPSSSSSSGESPSFSASSLRQEPSSSFRGRPSASLFSPVGPAPPGRRIWMQTYARAPARKKTLQRGAKAAWLSSETGNPRSRSGSETRPKAAASYKPKILTVERPAPGLAPAKVYDIPQSLGGWAIRRLGHSAQNQVEIQKPQLRPAAPPVQTPGPQQKEVKAKVPSVYPESRWTRVKLRPKL